MEKSIALFGTSADPPTIGHKKILEELSKIYAITILGFLLKLLHLYFIKNQCN